MPTGLSQQVIESQAGQSAHEHTRAGVLVWWPVPCFTLAVAVLTVVKLHAVFEPWWLLPVLNIGILFGGAVIAASLAAWGYLAGGSRAILQLGSAMLTFGLGSLAAAILLPAGRVNAAVTIYNMGALLAGALHLASALDLSLPRLLPRPSFPARWSLLIWFGGCTAAMAAITLLSLLQLLPAFMTPAGGTPLRQLVLILTVIAFLVSAILFRLQDRRLALPFLRWYWCGLALIGIGLIAVSLTPVGTPLGWIGRVAQVLGQVYLVISLLVVVRRPQAVGPVGERIGLAFQQIQQAYDAILNAAAEGIWMIDPRGVITLANPQFARMLGRPVAEIVGQPLSAFVLPGDTGSGDLLIASSWQVERGRLEFRLRRHDGAGLWTATSTSRLLDAEGHPVGVLGLSTDITERKHAEEALKRSEERYRSLFESMGEGFVLARMIYNEDGTPCDYQFIEVNPAYERLTGLPMDLSLQRTIKQLIPSLEPEWIERHARVVETGEPVTWESYNAQVGQHYRIYTFRPGPGLFASIFSNISAQITAEHALRESEERFRTMADGLPLMIWVHDARGKLQFVNNTYGEFFGVTPEEMQDDRWQPLVHPEEGPAYVEEFFRCVREHQPFHACTRVRNTDGAWRWIESFGRPRYSAPGEFLGHVGTSVDITDRKAAEEALHASLREKDVLLKEIHHRVKNNMQVISSLVSLQADALDDPAIRSVFNDLRDQVRTMALVHEKLYQSERLSLIDFAEYAGGLLAYIERAYSPAATDIRVTLDADPLALSIETAVPCGLILNELVTNAFKHAFRDRASGEIIVTLRVEAEGRVSLQVRDTGAGLPAGMDWRHAPSLGLQLVQMLAGQLRGTIEMLAGQGTTFQLTFTPPIHTAVKDASDV